MFIGRKRELGFLEERWERGRFEFGTLTGLRRIGKTALVRKFIEGKPAICFQAKEAAEAENRRSFSRLLAIRLGLPPGYVFPTWDGVFEAVPKVAGGKRFALVIDGCDWLLRGRGKRFLTAFTRFLGGLPLESPLFILLVGGNTSFNERGSGRGSSLFRRRRTFTLRLGDLPFSEALSFLRGFSREDASASLALFGFSPWRLSLLRPEAGFEGNARRLLFSRAAPLLRVLDCALSGGIRERSIYKTILRAIASGRTTPKAISEYMEAGTPDVSQYLDTLVSLGIVERRVAFGSVRKSSYRIAAPVLRFFLRELEDEEGRIASGEGGAVMREKAASIRRFAEERFGEVSLHYLSELSLDGKLGYPWPPVQDPGIRDPEPGRAALIDGVSEYKSQILLVKCGGTDRKLSEADFLGMQEDSPIGNLRGKKSFWYVLFSKAGFEKTLARNAPANLRLISEADMFPGFPETCAA